MFFPFREENQLLKGFLSETIGKSPLSIFCERRNLRLVKDGKSVIDLSAGRSYFLSEKRWYRELQLHSSFYDGWGFLFCSKVRR